MKKLPLPFENHMSRRQTIAGLIYLPIHIFLLPLLLPALMMNWGITDLGTANLLYYGVGLAFALTVFFGFLRAHFDTLLDRFGLCILTFLMALGLDYVLSLGVNAIVMALTNGVDNPNDGAIMDIAQTSGGAIRAVAIFMAPVLEEVLFRGVVFGNIRHKNRVAAYVLSVLMFSIYHVWQYAFMAADWSILIYVLQYLPVSFVLAWAYERSGSIWVPIGFHMMINSMSLAVEKMVAELM